jgi:TrpR-related protein YerC/YecD
LKEAEHINTKSKFNDNLSDQLFSAVLSLKTHEECSRFFEDICTINEVRAMAQRFEVARMLNEGHIYDEIVAKTGASTATISRVKRSLNYGANGYNIALSRL